MGLSGEIAYTIRLTLKSVVTGDFFCRDPRLQCVVTEVVKSVPLFIPVLSYLLTYTYVLACLLEQGLRRRSFVGSWRLQSPQTSSTTTQSRKPQLKRSAASRTSSIRSLSFVNDLAISLLTLPHQSQGCIFNNSSSPCQSIQKVRSFWTECPAVYNIDTVIFASTKTKSFFQELRPMLCENSGKNDCLNEKLKPIVVEVMILVSFVVPAAACNSCCCLSNCHLFVVDAGSSKI